MPSNPHRNPENKSFESREYAGFLAKRHREWLLGEKDVSDGYERALRSEIGKRIKGGLTDFQLLVRSDAYDTPDFMKVPRLIPTGTEIPPHLEGSLTPTVGPLRPGYGDLALDAGMAIAKMYAGEVGDEMSANAIEYIHSMYDTLGVESSESDVPDNRSDSQPGEAWAAELIDKNGQWAAELIDKNGQLQDGALLELLGSQTAITGRLAGLDRERLITSIRKNWEKENEAIDQATGSA